MKSRFIENNLRGLFTNPDKTIASLSEDGKFLQRSPQNDLEKKQVTDDAIAAGSLENAFRYWDSQVFDLIFNKLNADHIDPQTSVEYEEKFRQLFQDQIGSQNFGELFGTNKNYHIKLRLVSAKELIDKIQNVQETQQPAAQAQASQKEPAAQAIGTDQNTQLHSPLITDKKFLGLETKEIPTEFYPDKVKELLNGNLPEWNKDRFAQLQRLDDKDTKGRTIKRSDKEGIGNYSNVTLVKDLRTNRLSACKRLPSEVAVDLVANARSWKEAYFLALFQQRVPEIVRLHEIYYERRVMGMMSPVILMEPLMPENGWFKLNTIIEKNKSKQFIELIGKKLVKAIHTIEETYRWQYRDFKDDCVFVRERPNGEPEIQIIDFTHVQPPGSRKPIDDTSYNPSGRKELAKLWRYIGLDPSEFEKEWLQSSL